MRSGGGRGGSDDFAGVGKTGRGASLRGSTVLRKVVKTSGSSEDDANGRSRLSCRQLRALAGVHMQLAHQQNDEYVDLLIDKVLLILPQLELHAHLATYALDSTFLSLLFYTFFTRHPHSTNFGTSIVLKAL